MRYGAFFFLPVALPVPELGIGAGDAPRPQQVEEGSSRPRDVAAEGVLGAPPAFDLATSLEELEPGFAGRVASNAPRRGPGKGRPRREIVTKPSGGLSLDQP